MEFVKLNGYISEDSNYISITIKNGDNRNNYGDQVWISPDGTEMEIDADADAEVLNRVMNLFQRNHQRAFKGAMERMDCNF